MKLTEVLKRKGIELKQCQTDLEPEYGDPADWPAVEKPLVYEKGKYYEALVDKEIEFIPKIACIKDGHIYSQLPGKDEKGFFMEWIDQGPVEKNTLKGWLGGLESYVDIVNQRIDEKKQEADLRYRMEVHSVILECLKNKEREGVCYTGKT
jgi:hypothetical protein